MRRYQRAVIVFALLAASWAQAADHGVTGKKLLLKSNPKMVLLSKDPLIVPGAPGSASDPRCVAAGGSGSGASVTIADGTNSATLAMPCEHWTAAGSASYRYRNAGGVPKVGKLKSGLLKTTGAANISIPNGPATVTVDVTVGADRYCMAFSGTGDGDKFLVKNTAAGTCTPLQTCGNDVREGTEECDGSDDSACSTSNCQDCVCAGVAVPLVTSQQTCFDSLGASIPCTGTGQDGELRKGRPRNFVDNGNGTITDLVTGLMWEKLGNDDSIHDRDRDFTWLEAWQVKIAALNATNFAGHSDWRLPNVIELHTLVDHDASEPTVDPIFNTECPAVQPCDPVVCSCTEEGAYWSSTTYTDANGQAWVVDFHFGEEITATKTRSLSVRAVRGSNTSLLKSGQITCYDDAGAIIACTGTGQDADLRLGLSRAHHDNGDGTVTDVRTGLMWEKLSLDGSIHHHFTSYTWAGAFGKIATLNAEQFAGHSDWRLPNVNELYTIVDLEFMNPSVLPAFDNSCVEPCTVATCSCTASARYWTSTTYALAPESAWIVFFDAAERQTDTKTREIFVRAVRGGP